jgi:hypothetical protein
MARQSQAQGTAAARSPGSGAGGGAAAAPSSRPASAAGQPRLLGPPGSDSSMRNSLQASSSFTSQPRPASAAGYGDGIGGVRASTRGWYAPGADPGDATGLGAHLRPPAAVSGPALPGALSAPAPRQAWADKPATLGATGAVPRQSVVGSHAENIGRDTGPGGMAGAAAIGRQGQLVSRASVGLLSTHNSPAQQQPLDLSSVDPQVCFLRDFVCLNECVYTG